MVARSTSVALVVTASIVAAAAAQAPRDRRSAATASITGVVLSDDSPAKPLRRALVLLTGAETSVDRTAVTSDDGSFSFERLPPDAYTLAARKDGYIAVSWGAARPARPGRAFTLGG